MAASKLPRHMVRQEAKTINAKADAEVRITIAKADAESQNSERQSRR